jgi:hypothetical protein
MAKSQISNQIRPLHKYSEHDAYLIPRRFKSMRHQPKPHHYVTMDSIFVDEMVYAKIESGVIVDEWRYSSSSVKAACLTVFPPAIQ